MMIAIAARIARWRRFQATQRVLEGLDERTLKDIGLYRRGGAPACEAAMLRTLGLR